MFSPLQKLFSLLTLALVLHPLGAFAENLPLPAENKPSELWSAEESSVTVALLGGVALFSLLDEPLRTKIQKGRSPFGKDVADGIATIGHPAVTLGFSGLLWGVSQWQGDPRGAETGLLALESVAASQMACVLLKVSVGRHRPDAQDDSTSFHPFSLSDEQQSFPSSHTASAFALAALLARRSVSPYAPYGYYGAATMVGIARLYQDEHWASDVIAGALIGELSARLVLNWHARENRGLTITPYAGERLGLVATLLW